MHISEINIRDRSNFNTDFYKSNLYKRLKKYQGSYEIERKIKDPKKFIIRKSNISSEHKHLYKKFKDCFDGIKYKIKDQKYKKEFRIVENWNNNPPVERNLLIYDISYLPSKIIHPATYDEAEKCSKYHFLEGAGSTYDPEIFYTYGWDEFEIGQYIEFMLRIFAEIGKNSQKKSQYIKFFSKLLHHINKVKSNMAMKKYFIGLLSEIDKYLS